MSTSSCGGGGGSSSATNSFYTNTFVEDDKELSEKEIIIKQLSEKHRVRLKLNGQTHFVGVKSLTVTSAVIEVTSLPQEKELKVGDSWRVDVDGNGYYDLKIVLSSVSSGKANVSMESVYEKVSAGSSVVSNSEEPLSSADDSPESKLPAVISRSMLFIAIAVVIIVLGIAGFLFSRKRSKK